MDVSETATYRVDVEPTPDEGERYQIWIGGGLLDRAGAAVAEVCRAGRYAVISDSRVAGLYAPRLLEALGRAGLSAEMFQFPAGEWNKSRESWSALTDGLLRAGLGRDSAVVALGGGVTGDLAGFVAATYMRGIPVIQIPTTLLAMIDASIGGKTGVDTRAGKNLVGAFHPPLRVLVDPTVLGTLPVAELASGLAEAFKHGLILDAEYFERTRGDAAAILAAEPAALERLIRRSIEIKARVVSRDVRERRYRQILNVGHTVAHAVEALSGYALRHGEAVAIGLVAEARLGEAVGITRPGVAARVEDALEAARLPVALDADVDPARFMEVIGVDKKRVAGRPRYALLERIGRVARAADGGWSHEIADGVVRSVIFGSAGAQSEM
jgi:3-dehydroquinate synthase